MIIINPLIFLLLLPDETINASITERLDKKTTTKYSDTVGYITCLMSVNDTSTFFLIWN